MSSSSHSFIQVVENRLRMQHGVSVIPNLSVQQLISCNYMNEGCQGGWSIFDGFFAENVGLFAQDCYPYSGKNGQCQYQSKISTNDTDTSHWCRSNFEIAKVTKSYQVEPTETGIQKEILKNGMVDVTWSFPIYAQHFGTGILKISPDNAQAKEGADMIDELSHTSSIIGWGVDPKDGTKYWIVRNAFGQTWGENGDFKVIRGQNAFNIESFPGGYDVIL